MADYFHSRVNPKKTQPNSDFGIFMADMVTKREAIWGAKIDSKTTPKQNKIEVDFQERKDTLQDRLGNVLEPFWADLGPS